jgi:hypothetical protein
VKQHDDFSITVDQREYWKKVKPIKLPPERKRQPEAPLTQDEFNALRSLIGKLSWPARESEPRIAFGVSELQQSMTKDKGGDVETMIEHILMANRIVGKMRIESNQTMLKFKAVDPAQLCVLSFTDASFANMPRGGSQAGRFSMLTSADVVVKRVPVNIVGWRSGRISRIVKSTISAEAASLADSRDDNEYTRVATAYMFGMLPASDRAWKKALDLVKGYTVVDARSLYDHLHSDATPTEKRVMLDLLAFREGLERPEDEVFWMPNQWMLADYLTKAKVDDFAIDYLLSRGEYALSEAALEAP